MHPLELETLMRRSLMTFALAGIVLISLGRVTDAAPATQPAKPVIAVFSLHGEVPEKPSEDELPFFGPVQESLKDIVERMKKAEDDANVKAVVLLCDIPFLGLAQVEELRAEIDRLAAKDKEVYAY